MHESMKKESKKEKDLLVKQRPCIVYGSRSLVASKASKQQVSRPGGQRPSQHASLLVRARGRPRRKGSRLLLTLTDEGPPRGETRRGERRRIRGVFYSGQPELKFISVLSPPWPTACVVRSRLRAVQPMKKWTLSYWLVGGWIDMMLGGALAVVADQDTPSAMAGSCIPHPHPQPYPTSEQARSYALGIALPRLQ